MSGVRVLVGTKKGSFILTSDGKREKWEVSGPHFAGWEVYHLKGSPVNPERIYASQSSDWHGPVTQRSVLDALEERYPVLRGTIRDHATQQRRAFIRFFACKRDLSHEGPDAPLPKEIESGEEPLLVVGAIAGG